MTKKRIINFIGVAFLVFLGLVKIYYPERFSLIVDDLGGFICMMIGVSLMLYTPKGIKYLIFEETGQISVKGFAAIHIELYGYSFNAVTNKDSWNIT